MTRVLRLLAIPLLTALCAITITADEGMYPLSEIHRVNLKAKGLKIDVREIYNPNGPSLVDAICRVGGGTGEFVSADGLILTNHHIAFEAVSTASTPERDYLRDGFTARTRTEEIPAKGYTCLITEAYRDVSAEVLSAATPAMSPAERSTALRARMRELAEREKAGRENIQCEVSEMFPGRSYVLFTYRLITDVRMVYIPPISVGNFGGEEDNWVWPRHTGDFSFLRAYVAPDGSTRAYSTENVPFRPKRWLRVNPKGVRENDFVMVLGYPGRTFRHKTSHYLAVQEDIMLPTVSKRFDRLIATVEEATAGERALQLAYADYVKSLANVTKNYKGKMQGLRRLQHVEAKRTEERALQAFIERTPDLQAKYAGTLGAIGRVYDAQRTWQLQELTWSLLSRNTLMGLVSSVLAHTEAPQRTEETAKKLRADMAEALRGAAVEVELRMLSGLLHDALRLPKEQDVLGFTLPAAALEGRGGPASVLDALRAATPLSSSQEGLLRAMQMTPAAIDSSGDLLFRAAKGLRAAAAGIRQRQRERDGELTRLEADLLEARMRWKNTAFIPDANSTLRLTYGYIRGYAPADAVRYAPLTTLRGLVEKYRGEEPFDLPKQLLDIIASRSYNRALEDPALKDVPVAMLYNLDTTGGNSGSPVLNARGELVGVNFDRAYEATINDFQWSESYSRSIGVDIRYVLFIARYLGGADFLLKELGVSL